MNTRKRFRETLLFGNPDKVPHFLEYARLLAEITGWL